LLWRLEALDVIAIELAEPIEIIQQESDLTRDAGPGCLATGHDDRHLVQSRRDRAPEPHVGTDALDEIAELGASQQRVEGTAQAGAARARLDGIGHALLIRGHGLRRQRRESRLTHHVPP